MIAPSRPKNRKKEEAYRPKIFLKKNLSAHPSLCHHVFQNLAYEATRISIFIIKATIQEQTATAEQQTATAISDQLVAFREKALAEARANRPKNTRIAYERKQAEWMVSLFFRLQSCLHTKTRIRLYRC